MAHEDRLSLKRAIGISAALHLLLVPLLFAVPILTGNGTATGGGLALDRQSEVTTLAIVHRPKAERHEAVRIARAPVPAEPQLQHHRRIAPPRVVHDAPVAGVAADAVAPAVHAPRVAHGEAGPAEPSPLAGTPQPAAQAPEALAPTPAPTPSAAPTVAAAAVAMSQKAAPDRGLDAAAGGWGQNFDSPMLSDETALADLKAKYHVAGITIKVDESGRALRVIVPANVPEEARDEIVQRLSAMHYVPAECNGLRCAGTLVVSL